MNVTGGEEKWQAIAYHLTADNVALFPQKVSFHSDTR
jgi:hypothetical protein